MSFRNSPYGKSEAQILQDSLQQQKEFPLTGYPKLVAETLGSGQSPDFSKYGLNGRDGEIRKRTLKARNKPLRMPSEDTDNEDKDDELELAESEKWYTEQQKILDDKFEKIKKRKAEIEENSIMITDRANEQKATYIRLGKEHEQHKLHLQMIAEKEEKEILEKLNKLKEEVSASQQKDECIICCENKITTVFFPCGHMICCGTCSEKIDKCPNCRKEILMKTKVFIN
jgi:hypothetical protein